MNLLTYYIKRNKGFLISSIILLIVIFAALGIPYFSLNAAMPSNYIKTTGLEHKLFSIISIVGIALTFVLLISTLVNLLTNSIGKKRTMLMVFYGKKKFMLYQFAITFLLIVFMCLVITFGMSTFILVFKMNSGMLIDDVIKNYFVFKIFNFSIVISIIGSIVLYMFLSLKETLVNTSLKYDKPFKKAMYMTFRVVMYLLLLFLLFDRNMPFLTNYGFRTINGYFSFSMGSSLYPYFIVVTLIIVVIDYIKISKDKMFR